MITDKRLMEVVHCPVCNGTCKVRNKDISSYGKGGESFITCFECRGMGHFLKCKIISLSPLEHERGDILRSIPNIVKENIITLCGSSKFKEQYLLINHNLSLLGKIVLSVSCFGHTDKLNLDCMQKNILDDVHLKKIDLSEAIYVINFGKYIGDSTRKEIEYAEKKGKKIYYLERPQEVKPNSSHE